LISIFRKENVFTCLTFGAIFVFAVIQTMAPSNDLVLIAWILSIFIFLISLLKLVISIFEDIIVKQTELLRKEENDGLFNYEYGTLSSEQMWEIRNSKKCVPKDILSEIQKKENAENILTKVQNYKTCFDMRKTFRCVRRALLWMYYIIFMLILVILLLRTEISNVINVDSIKLLGTNILTMWSLVIILVEIMMKDIIEQIIINFLTKKYEIDFWEYW